MDNGMKRHLSKQAKNVGLALLALDMAASIGLCGMHIGTFMAVAFAVLGVLLLVLAVWLVGGTGEQD